jgi:hypothetical protein
MAVSRLPVSKFALGVEALPLLEFHFLLTSSARPVAKLYLPCRVR